jgi:uncharacterized protein YxeA
MKKTILILLAFALAVSVGIAYAATANYSTGTVTLGNTLKMTFTTSNNVYVDYKAGTNGVSYTAGSYHQTGSRTFATSSGDTKIYYKDGTGADIPAAPAGAGSTADFGGWTAL